MKKLIVLLLLVATSVNAQKNDPVEEAAMGAAGGAIIGFVGSGYVGAIFGGLGQAALIYEQEKYTSSPKAYLTNFKGPYMDAYRLDRYRVLNPYDGKEVWIGNRTDGTFFRDTEGRLFIIQTKK